VKRSRRLVFSLVALPLFAIVALPLLAILYWVALPPLAIERTAEEVKVHVERLGEYNSALTEFVIIDDETQEVVVRFVPLLHKGHRYKVSVKGFSMFGTELLPLRLRRTATFVL
jgi:hypothetical protein